MRIGMVGPGLDEPGGIAAVARSLLGSAALDGIDVRYVASTADGGPARKLAQMARGQALFARILAGRSPPDLVHLHVGAPIVTGRVAAARYASFWRKVAYLGESRLAGRPAVLHLHGSDGLIALHDGSPAGARAVEGALRRSAAVLVVSERMRGAVRGWIGDAVPVHVLYNPVDVRAFATSPLPERPTVLFLGLIGAAKGVFDLLAAMPRVLDAVPDARFVFAGLGEIDRLRAEAARLGVLHAVETPGWLAADAKRRALEGCWVFALPSYFEGLPVSVLEAMASGRAVVATDIAGLPEAVADGVSGLLVRPGDQPALAEALVRLLLDRVRCAAFGHAGRLRAEAQFDRDRLARDLRSVWERVREERGPCR